LYSPYTYNSPCIIGIGSPIKDMFKRIMFAEEQPEKEQDEYGI
jgi:hypothetical protein